MKIFSKWSLIYKIRSNISRTYHLNKIDIITIKGLYHSIVQMIVMLLDFGENKYDLNNLVDR